jgi:predicted nucleotidyltransferase
MVNTEQKIFRVLCIKAGTKLNQRELSRLTNTTPSGIAKTLTKLTDKVQIEKHPTMNLNLISLKRTQKVMQFKQLENLKQLYELNLIEKLEETFPGTTIILFGSYAKGEDTIKSDIDFAIIGTKSKPTDLQIFEKKLERIININFYQSFHEINTELKENLCNGLVLVGGITL